MPGSLCWSQSAFTKCSYPSSSHAEQVDNDQHYSAVSSDAASVWRKVCSYQQGDCVPCDALNKPGRWCDCRLMTLANYAMKLEREVWGALGGPWGSDTWMSWRRDWAQKVTVSCYALAFPTLPHFCILCSLSQNHITSVQSKFLPQKDVVQVLSIGFLCSCTQSPVLLSKSGLC